METTLLILNFLSVLVDDVVFIVGVIFSIEPLSALGSAFRGPLDAGRSFIGVFKPACLEDADDEGAGYIGTGLNLPRPLVAELLRDW